MIGSSVLRMAAPVEAARIRHASLAAGREAPNAPPTMSPIDGHPLDTDPHIRVDIRGTVLGGNPSGMRVLDTGTPLTLRDARLQPLDATLADGWTRALLTALQRRAPVMFVTGNGSAGEPLAIVPDADGEFATVRFQRMMPCDPTALAAYSSAVGLTDAEMRVMEQLAQGLSPREIAARGGKAESTVRSQVRAVLAKSGHPGIRPLLLQLARLPRFG